MKAFSLLMVVVMMFSILCGCNSSISDEHLKDSNDPLLVDNPEELMPQQQEEMIELYNDNKQLFHKIFDMIFNYGVVEIQSDGKIVYDDGSAKWVDEISREIKNLHNVDKKEYQHIRFRLDGNDTKYYLLEVYYPKSQTLYTFVYSTADLTQSEGSFLYIKLDTNWFLWESPMT